MSESSPSDSHPSLTANVRAEIDSSSRFVSVREAATRFGGFGFWRPHSSESLQDNAKEGDIIELKRQTAELQNYLMVKECETLDVLKELELTKARIINLNSKLQQKKKKNKESLAEEVHCHIKPAGMVLQDLNKAKMNLCKRTVDLAGLRRSVEVLSKQLKEEKDAFEKTRERLMHKSLKVISLEKEEEAKKGETSEKDLENNALRMINEVRRLSCEAQEYKKTGEKAMAEIKHTREKIKTVEIKLVAARKMKEAARAAAEAVAIAEIKAVAGSENTVTISAEEYAKLTLDARDAEEEAWKRVEDAMSTVEEANVSEMDTLKRADEAAQEVEASKRAFEEAVERENTANATKLEAEEALRNLKSEKGQRRRSSVNNTAKFKTRRETITNSLMDVNGLHLTYDFVPGPSSSSVPVLKPTMSIGQILSKKLLVAEDSDMSVVKERSKMSLGQMLAKNSNGDGTLSKKSEGKENEKRSVKRKNLGFAKIVLLLNKESKNNKKNKKIGLNLR